MQVTGPFLTRTKNRHSNPSIGDTVIVWKELEVIGYVVFKKFDSKETELSGAAFVNSEPVSSSRVPVRMCQVL